MTRHTGGPTTQGYRNNGTSLEEYFAEYEGVHVRYFATIDWEVDNQEDTKDCDVVCIEIEDEAEVLEALAFSGFERSDLVNFLYREAKENFEKVEDE